MYDDTCRFLAEHFSADFASWLLKESVTLTEIQPSELSLDSIQADAMILLQSDPLLLNGVSKRVTRWSGRVTILM